MNGLYFQALIIISMVIVAIIAMALSYHLIKKQRATPPNWIFKKALKEIGPNKPFKVTKVNGKWEYTPIDENKSN